MGWLLLPIFKFFHTSHYLVFLFDDTFMETPHLSSSNRILLQSFTSSKDMKKRGGKTTNWEKNEFFNSYPTGSALIKNEFSNQTIFSITIILNHLPWLFVGSSCAKFDGQKPFIFKLEKNMRPDDYHKIWLMLYSNTSQYCKNEDISITIYKLVQGTGTKDSTYTMIRTTEVIIFTNLLVFAG